MEQPSASRMRLNGTRTRGSGSQLGQDSALRDRRLAVETCEKERLSRSAGKEYRLVS